MAGAKGRNEMHYMWDNSQRNLFKMRAPVEKNENSCDIISCVSLDNFSMPQFSHLLSGEHSSVY